MRQKMLKKILILVAVFFLPMVVWGGQITIHASSGGGVFDGDVGMPLEVTYYLWSSKDKKWIVQSTHKFHFPFTHTFTTNLPTTEKNPIGALIVYDDTEGGIDRPYLPICITPKTGKKYCSLSVDNHGNYPQCDNINLLANFWSLGAALNHCK